MSPSVQHDGDMKSPHELIDRRARTVNNSTPDVVERTTTWCDRCSGEVEHRLLYAFAPPSDYARWRCTRCKIVRTVRVVR